MFYSCFDDLVEKTQRGDYDYAGCSGTHLGPSARRRSQRPYPKPGVSALRYSLAAPAVRDVQSSDWSRWYTPHKRPRRNIARHDRSGRDDGVVTDGHAGKDRRRTTDPDVGAKTNWRKPGWMRRLHGMEVTVENGRQVPDQAIVSDHDATIGNNRGTGVNEDTLAQHEGAIPGRAQLDWYRLAAKVQASARDGSVSEQHGPPTIHRHDGRSRTRPAEDGRGPQAGGHVTNLNH
jgi:hypothetical protein